MNNELHKVVAYVNTTWEHVYVLLVGLIELDNSKEIDLSLEYETDISVLNQSGMRIRIDGIDCFLDVTDGYNNIDFICDQHNKYTVWFKRSYSKETNDSFGLNNIVPLGLNYGVTNTEVERLCRKTKKKKTIIEGIKKIIYQAIKLTRDMDILESDIGYQGDIGEIPTICFFTRLWEGKDTLELNRDRIDLIRKLKNRYGDRFYGGVSNSHLAQKLCPDITISRVKANRKKYIELMHRCDICIATTGLHGSIGWKFSEYVAAGKVILSEPLNYEVPYGFSEGKNYLLFNTSDECLDIIDGIIDDRDLLCRISNNNKQYYQEHLNPKSMVRDIINYVVEGIG